MAVYNRYVAQADGSFLKTRLPDPKGSQGQYAPDEIPFLPSPGSEKETCPREYSRNSISLGSFFQNLFPQGLDTEDLIVILLLLLLSQDGGKNGNRSLLTLGAYLFL